MRSAQNSSRPHFENVCLWMLGKHAKNRKFQSDCWTFSVGVFNNNKRQWQRKKDGLKTKCCTQIWVVTRQRLPASLRWRLRRFGSSKHKGSRRTSPARKKNWTVFCSKDLITLERSIFLLLKLCSLFVQPLLEGRNWDRVFLSLWWNHQQAFALSCF